MAVCFCTVPTLELNSAFKLLIILLDHLLRPEDLEHKPPHEIVRRLFIAYAEVAQRLFVGSDRADHSSRLLRRMHFQFSVL